MICLFDWKAPNPVSITNPNVGSLPQHHQLLNSSQEMVKPQHFSIWHIRPPPIWAATFPPSSLNHHLQIPHTHTFGGESPSYSSAYFLRL